MDFYFTFARYIFASIKGTVYRFIVSIYNRYILQHPEYGRAHRQ